MYILISILLSLMYTLQISCAATSHGTPVLPYKIHTIFNKCTQNSTDGRSLAELLQDRDACVQGSLYMELLRSHRPYQQLIHAIKNESHKKKRKKLWQQLDYQVYLFLTQKRAEVLDNPRLSAAMQNSALKGLVMTNVFFQHEWSTIDKGSFDSAFHDQIAGSKSSKRADPASSSTARVPRSLTKRHVHRRER